MSRGRLSASGIAHPFHGVVQEPRPTAPDDLLLEACRQYSARMPAFQFFSHGTALQLIHAPVPRERRDEIHVSAHRPAREPRTRGVHGHRLQAREPRLIRIQGLRVEHPVRAWRQASATWSPLALTQAGDFLMARRHPWTTVEALREELAIMGGTTAAWLALDDVRDGSESPRETELRLVIVRGGLPEPMSNWELRDDDGLLIARLDLAYVREKVAVEYDGRQHADNAAQFARDADRWRAIQDEGWLLVRVLNHHMADGGAVALEMVRSALRMRGRDL